MGEMFDAYGRCIPDNLQSKAQKKVRRYFRCDQPAIDLGAIYDTITTFLGGTDQLSKDDFVKRIENLIERLEQDEKHKGILNGVRVPFFIPRQEITDIGEMLDEVFLPGVAKAYQDKFSDYEFINHHKNPLKGTLSIADNTGHQALVENLQDGPVVGIYFPALDGYSIPAAREQSTKLADNFSLAGGIDTCAALIAAPDLLLRKEGYPPLLWFGALETDKTEFNYHIEAYGYDLNFNRRVHLGNADEYWANGIVVTD